MPAAVASPTDFRTPHQSIPLTKQLLTTATIVLVLAAGYTGHAWWRTGSARLILPYIQGQRIFFTPLTVAVDDAPPKSSINRNIEILNLTSSRVTLIGAKSSCGCITLDEFPVRIPAGKSHSFELEMTTPSKPVNFEHTVRVYFDSSGCQKMVVRVIGKVSSSSLN